MLPNITRKASFVHCELRVNLLHGDKIMKKMMFVEPTRRGGGDEKWGMCGQYRFQSIRKSMQMTFPEATTNPSLILGYLGLGWLGLTGLGLHKLCSHWLTLWCLC